ncbi:MAG: elongation factor Ts [Candidatus Shapirobacteria bacterium]
MDQKEVINLVKKIRAEMGLGMMEIKAAVEESGCDETKAKQILKEKGFKKAETKAERETHQGRVATYTHNTGKIGVMVSLLCETDFVAKHEDFIELTKEICLQIAAMNPETVEDLMKQEFVKDPSKTIEEMIKALIVKFGENMKIKEFARFEI